jgi:prepilin-type N-terminal cleavage/methylation domain-containing protein
MLSERRHRNAGERGFTLLETLVALAVLGIVLTSLFRLAGSTLVQYTGREARLLMAITAESALNAERLQPGSASGIAWPSGLTVEIERQALATEAVADSAGDLDPPTIDRSIGQDLEWLTIRVGDASGRQYALAGAVARPSP